jgi:hypothetical protein
MLDYVNNINYIERKQLWAYRLDTEISKRASSDSHGSNIDSNISN